jgi:hypothetical protein
MRSATLTKSGSALYGSMVAFDSEDGIFVTGSYPNETIITAKFDQAGAQIWLSELDSPGTREQAAWLTVDPSGNVIVAGHNVTGANANPTGFVTLKYDTNGTLLW